MKRHLVVLLFGPVACAPSRRFETVDVTTGRALKLETVAMPYDATFSGCYVSPQLGTLSLEQHGGELSGTYSNDTFGCLMQGTLRGKRDSNRVEFAFVEQCGGGARRLDGTGVVFYVPPEPDEPAARLFGERFLTIPPRSTQGPSSSRRLGAFSAILASGADSSVCERPRARGNCP